MNNLISIITPFYQAERYLSKAIESVLNQSYSDWELLLINDGSTDQSKAIALSFQDSRIRYLEQENKGVSAARNVGLKNMQGQYFCFLDADDVYPENSLMSRMQLFEQNPTLEFVDGVINKMDEKLCKTKEIWEPSFQGNPVNDLIQLTGKSFFGPSWMIKRRLRRNYYLEEGLTHCEDLYFYILLARDGGKYDYVDEPILYYRDNPNSAMKNLKGLEKGYRFVAQKVKSWPEVNKLVSSKFSFKYKRAMFLAYIREGSLFNAIKLIR